MSAKKKRSNTPKPLVKNKGGRPAVITAAVVDEVCGHMALGVPEEYACAMVGVNPATFGPAVSRSEVFKAISRGHHAKFMAESLGFIKQGGERITLKSGEDKDGNDIFVDKVLPWQGRAWILERRYKPHFNRTEVVKPQQGPGEGGGLMTEQDMADLEKAMKQQILRGGLNL